MIDFFDLRYQQSVIEGDLMQRINKVLHNTHFIKGEEVRELEESLEIFLSVKHCISVANGTDALQIALMSLNISPGDEVIVPAFSFIATAEAIAILGAKPVFVDVDKYSYNIDPGLIENAVTNRTKAIVAVSLFGQCADYDEIKITAKKYNIPVIEDGAQSFGAMYKGRKSCNLTKVATTSFFPTKPLGCYGDGGAIFTNDDELAEKLRSISNHGQEQRYHHIRVGVNSRLDTLQAAVLLAKMEVFENELKNRKSAGEYYSQRLKNINSILTPRVEPYNDSVFAQYTVQLDNRDEVHRKLKKMGIPTAIHYPLPLNKQPAIYEGGASVPVSEYHSDHVLSLPMHAYIKEDVQERVCEGLIAAIND